MKTKVFLVIISLFFGILPYAVFSQDVPPPPPGGDGGGDNVTPPPLPPNGNETSQTLLYRAKNDAKVYAIQNNKRQWIPTAGIFTQRGFKWSDVKTVTSTELNKYPRVKLLRAEGDSKVYYLTESGMIRHMPSAEVFTSYGNRWEDIASVSQNEINAYSVNNLIRAEKDPKVYLLKGGQKHWVQTAEAFNRLKYDWSKIAPVNQTEFNYYQSGTNIE